MGGYCLSLLDSCLFLDSRLELKFMVLERASPAKTDSSSLAASGGRVVGTCGHALLSADRFLPRLIKRRDTDCAGI